MSDSVNDLATGSTSAGAAVPPVGDGDGIATPGKMVEEPLAGPSPEYHCGHCFFGGILGWNTLASFALGAVSGSSKLRVAMEIPFAGETAPSFFLMLYMPGGGALHGLPDSSPDLGR